MTGLDDTALDVEERAALDFVLALRRGWAGTVYPALRDQYGSGGPGDLDAATRRMHGLPLYPWFSWLERTQQKMLWRAACDVVLRRADQLRDALDGTADRAPGSLLLDPDLVLPGWYTETDIHIQPNGIWSDDLSAFVYELGAKIVMLRDNDGYKFHQLFARTALPDGEFTRVVDLGCGFGKSTRPLVGRYPGAEVIGVDLSAPVLRLAHAQAAAQGLAIQFRQADARRTGLPDGCADLVTGTMVLHEMPAPAIAETITEAARLLRPGGTVVFLEFWPTGDPFRDATVYEHAERNNEPYFRALFGSDLTALCGRVGLRFDGPVPFDERELGRCPQGYPPRDEWHFPWAVLAARKEA